MKRWTLRIVLLLILGCVTTVAVAWGCAYVRYTNSPNRAPYWGCDSNGRWWYIDYDQVGLGWRELRTGGSGNLSVSRGPGAIESSLPGEFDHGSYFSSEGNPGGFLTAGFPLKAFFGTWQLVPAEGGIGGGTLESRVYSLRTLGGDRRVWIPNSMIRSGFAINTLFYGVIWFGIFFGFGSARRAIRKRRGRCPKCNYDLRGELDNGCSECGWGRAG